MRMKRILCMVLACMLSGGIILIPAKAAETGPASLSKYANIIFPAGICLIGLLLFLSYTVLSRGSCTAPALRTRIYQGVFLAYAAWLALYLLVPSNFWLRVYCDITGQGADGIDVSALFSGSWNLVPMVLNNALGNATYGGWSWRMLLYNGILFVPWGILVPSVLKNASYNSVVINGVIASTVIELLQPIVGRSFDVDDIIMRFLGASLGFLLYSIVKNHQKSEKLPT